MESDFKENSTVKHRAYVDLTLVGDFAAMAQELVSLLPISQTHSASYNIEIVNMVNTVLKVPKCSSPIGCSYAKLWQRLGLTN